MVVVKTQITKLLEWIRQSMYTSNQTATGNSMQVQRQMHMSPEMKHCNSKSIKMQIMMKHSNNHQNQTWHCRLVQEHQDILPIRTHENGMHKPKKHKYTETRTTSPKSKYIQVEAKNHQCVNPKSNDRSHQKSARWFKPNIIQTKITAFKTLRTRVWTRCE
jgi:hypothetical protein